MLKKYLRSFANLSVNHTEKILAGVIILTLMLGYHASSLQLKISFDYLLPNNNPRVETFNQVLNVFENDSNILLIASGSEDSLKSFAFHIKPILESFDEWVSGVYTHTPVDFYRKNILKLMSPDELDDIGEIFYDPNLVPFLINLNNAFENIYLHSDNRIISHQDEKDAVFFLDKLQMFIRAQEEIMLETEAVDVGQKAVDAIVFGESLMFSPDRDMLLINIEPRFNMHLPINTLLRNVDGMEEIIDKTAIQHGIVAILVGPLVSTRNYYMTFLSEFWYLSILILAGFFFILMLSFRLFSIPFMCICTLIVSVVWTLGIYSFFMNAINLVFIVALMIFIVLGIGNCILLISGYMEKRKQGLNIEVSIQETLQRFGSGVIVGSGVVGLVFFTLTFSDIKVLQDLGTMAGIGIITTMMLSIILLPSMLIMLEKLHGNINPLHQLQDISYSSLGIGVEWIAKYRWISIILILFITGYIYYQDQSMYINTNLSSIGLHDSDTINTEDPLITSFGISSGLISIITDNLTTARVVTEKAREKKSNGLVESISDYIPDEEFSDKKFRFIRELRRKIKSREVRKQLSSYDMMMYKKEIERLEANIIELQDFSLMNDQYKIYEKTIELVGDGIDESFQGILSPFINALDLGMNRLKLTYFQEQFSTAFKSSILEMANTEPLTLDNLPLEIKTRFTGENNNIFRINIYPNQNIWGDTLFIDNFVNNSLSLNEPITGLPVLFVELKDRMSYYGFQSTRLILISIMLLLLIGLRNLKYALVIIASIISGIICTMGVLILLNTSINLMNIWVIPVIFSVGMNNAILVLQRWKQEKDLDTVYRSTGKAILITTVTLSVMVLPFWFTKNIGLIYFANIFQAGLWCSFLSNLIVIPPLLAKNTPR